MSHAYRFNERLNASRDPATNTSVTALLFRFLPNALNVWPAGKKNDLCGTDWWVECAGGKHVSVDAKIREKDYAAPPELKDDLALEVWSVKETETPGWTLDAERQTDYVLWYWQDTKRCCWLPFPMLCLAFRAHLKEWAKTYPTAVQRTERGDGSGFHSECVFVPRSVVISAINEVSSGPPASIQDDNYLEDLFGPSGPAK